MSNSTFPTTLDTFYDPTPSDTLGSAGHHLLHGKANDAIAALQAKVGVDNSPAGPTVDYLLKAATDPGHHHTTAALVGAAPLASPAFTGVPTAPTPAALDNSTKLATTAYADAATAVEKTRALAAEALAVPLTQKAAASGVASLDSTTNVPAAQLSNVGLAEITAPAWQANHSYVQGALVSNGGSVYAALIAFTSGATFNAANWLQVGVAPGTFVGVPGGTTVPAWAAATPYVKGQMVSFGGFVWMANSSFTSGASFNAANWTLVGDAPTGEAAQVLATGEETQQRQAISATVTLTSQVLRIAFFTARKTETVNNLRTQSSTTAAGATPSLCRMAAYQVNADGSLTLIGSTANDTTLFAATSTVYTRAVTAPFTKTAGQRYGFGLLVVTAATAPTVPSTAVLLISAEAGQAPIMSGVVTGQADLPAAVAAGGFTSSAACLYGVMSP